MPVNTLFKRFLAGAGLFFSVITVSGAAGEGHILGGIHGDLIDSCSSAKFCTSEAQAACKRMFRSAFEACDPLFYRDWESDDFTNCIAKATFKKEAEIVAGIDWEKCPRPPLPYVYQSEAIGPNDHPLVPEYFTDNSMDVRFPQLYGTVEGACLGGANRIEKLGSEKGLAKVTVSISSIDKASSYGPNHRDTAYTHLFSTPSYIAGTCFGTSTTVVLKTHSIFRKGEVFKTKYRDEVYVALQCHKEPKHKLCENLDSPSY